MHLGQVLQWHYILGKNYKADKNIPQQKFTSQANQDTTNLYI